MRVASCLDCTYAIQLALPDVDGFSRPYSALFLGNYTAGDIVK